MCLFHRRQLDLKSRRIFIAGNLCLISGLMLTRTLFAVGFGHRHPAIYDGLRLLLIGCAVCLLYWFARRSCGCASRS
ncbi:MAG: hypothetical protein ACLP7O_00210 [Terracidiphilus sp.]